jgi:hypothetical protein
MKAVLLIFIILLLGCKSSQNEPEELGFGAEKEKRFIEFDCPDIMSSYEDSFLKKVKDLDGYSWNQTNNIATIQISETKTLKINISGCEPILRSCVFSESKDYDLLENKNQIIQDLIWISKLICNEKENNIMEKILNDKTLFDIESGNEDDEFIFLYPKESDLESEEYFGPLIILENGKDNHKYSVKYLFQ